MSAKSSRIFQPADSPIFRTPPGTVSVPQGGLYVNFTVPTPSARVMAKVCLFYWNQQTGLPFPNSFPPDPACGFTFGPVGLLMWTAEKTTTGFYVPLANLFGSLANAVEQSIPLDLTMNPGGFYGTSGVSLDVQGGQDAVQGRVHIPVCLGYVTQNGINISLRVRYELVGSDMCQDEWDSLVAQMVVQCSAPVIFT